MKTKIKISILTTIAILIMGITGDTSAQWYGNYNYHKSWAGGWCLQDAQLDAVGPTPVWFWVYRGSDNFERHYTQRRVIADLWGWWMTCQYWDSTIPTVSALTYANAATNGWTNNTTITLNWSANDTGGSWLKNYDIKVYRKFWAQNNPAAVDYIGTITTPTAAVTYNYVWINGYSYKFEMISRDNATNISSSWLTSTDIARIDTVVPNAANLNNITALNLLATNSQAFWFTFNDTWAPVSLRSTFEDFSNPASWINVFNPSAFLFAHTSNQNISIVDWADRLQDFGTARQYTYRVTQICDQAGNCWNGVKDYDYRVYANPNSVPIPTNTNDITNLAWAVADWVARNFIHTIKDGYGNAIIPAAWISRTVVMGLTGVNNTMFLNQYNRGGGSSVFIDTNATPLVAAWNQALIARTSSNGNYILPVFVYTPSANGYVALDPISDPLAAFSFNTNLVVNDTLIGMAANKTFTQNLSNPSFKPMYTTAITGDIRNGWFIEGTQQDSNIVATDQRTNLIIPNSIELQLKFDGANAWNFNFYGWSTTANAISTSIAAKSAMVTNPLFATATLYTRLVENTVVGSVNDIQLSTHYSYNLDGHSIVYNSDIIWRNWWYWGALTAPLWNQVWIKIIGPIASNIIQSIVNGQFVSGTSIFGWLSRADARNSLNKSVTIATRNMIFSWRTGNVSTLSGLPSAGIAYSGSYIDKWSNSSILKILKTGWAITLDPMMVSGKRTLVIKWADLYITGDMYYDPAIPSSILGVILMKDESGNGWNLYINSSVTNIVGTYVIDGSVMSSNDGVTPLGTSNIGILKNQLYIYGSLVSENTIGGSRMIPYKCPSLINFWFCTSLIDAQKYDLNYLRRYYLYGGQPFSNGKVAGGETCPLGICTNINAFLKQKFTTTAEDLAKYPVIIEYNPNIRSNPPIGFETTKD